MKKISFALLSFVFIFSFSCKGMPDLTDDLKKNDEPDVSEITGIEPQIAEETEIITSEDAFPVIDEFIEPELYDEVVVMEDDTPVIDELIEPEIQEDIAIVEAEPALEEPVIQAPEPVVSVVEAPPVRTASETPSSPEVQIRPQAVVEPQIAQIPAQETVPQTPEPADEEPPQTADNPTEEKPLVFEGGPFVPGAPVVSALRNDPVIPPQSLPVIPAGGEIIYSRTVNAAVGQTIEIPFRGTGWVYQGELAAKRGISYDSRRLDPEGQNFIFHATEAGTYSLKFYKYDVIRDYILNDHVMVIAAPQANTLFPPADRGRVTALPRWPTTLDEAELRRSGVLPGADNADASPGSSVTERRETDSNTAASTQNAQQRQEPEPRNTASTQPQSRESQNGAPTQNANDALPQTDNVTTAGAYQFTGNPDELLKKAKEAFDEGKVQDAISLLDQYKYLFPSGSDEAYWFYGQFYEANTPSRNILLALDYYKRLINEYPQSGRCNDARRRIQYLERFYININ